jgi:EAL domain-containing protein (putative c-di-GMP-specific phosphodiesterase class I)
MNLKEQLLKKWEDKTIFKEITPRFTPRIDLKNGEKPVGAEVVIFWNGREANRFMPTAKEIGISNELYGEMVKKSIPYIVKALKIDPSLKFAFKLYRLQLESSEPIDEILKLFTDASVPLRNLEFESDLGFVKRKELSRSILEKLRSLSIAVDFVLETDEELCFPVHLFADVVIEKVKIRKHLTKFFLGETDMLSFENAVRFLRALISFFRELDISVLVGGVDRKEELDFLKVLGVDEVQGKYFGENLTGEEFISFIKNSA